MDLKDEEKAKLMEAFGKLEAARDAAALAQHELTNVGVQVLSGHSLSIRRHMIVFDAKGVPAITEIPREG